MKTILLNSVFAIVANAFILPQPLWGQLNWQQRGPGPITGADGQVESINRGEVVGAVNAIAAHPSDANIVYVGSVNGGIWCTKNALAVNPNWENLTSETGSLSIGALEFDPCDQQDKTLVAGFGRTSSLARLGSDLDGLLRTTDGGASWAPPPGNNQLVGLNISGVAPRCSTIVVSVDRVDGRPLSDRGIWRSIDSGGTWARVDASSGLPAGRSFDLVGDPNNPTVLYTNAGREGIFRSRDTGATWKKVSNSSLDQEMAGMTNCEIAVGNSGNVFVAVVRVLRHPSGDPRKTSDRLAAVFFSPDNGKNWDSLGRPTTTENGNRQFGAHPGGQGDIHLAIAADAEVHNRVYLGGDRQPDRNEGILNANQKFPNSIGATRYSARAFRGNAGSVPNRWVHLTHTQSTNGGGTASNSSPHADCREMDVDAGGDLLLGCDGGIYRRTNPRTNQGDWSSMNGDLQITEFHAVSWDAISNRVVGGAQDNGTARSETQGPEWDSVLGGDGAVTLVDDLGSPNISTRYISAQNLQAMQRRRFNANGQLVGPPQPVSMVVVDASGQPLFKNNVVFRIPAQFYTPLALNPVDTDRILFGGSDTVYESGNQGDTARRLTTANGQGVVVNSGAQDAGVGLDCLAYGAADNEDAIYAGSGANVFIRSGAPPQSLVRSQMYPGSRVRALVMHPDEFEEAYVADEDRRVFRTTDAGDQWTNVTNNLAAIGIGDIHAIAYRESSDELFIGGQRGIASANGPNFNNWSRLGNGLPNAPVYHLEYDADDDLLLAGTLGRGAWTLSFP